MEVKKNPKADLRGWRGVFLLGGLILALGLCNTSFSISQKDKTVERIDLGGVADETEMIDVTQQLEEIKVEPQKQTVAVLADVFDIVKNDTEVDFDPTFFEMDDVIDIETIDFGEEVIEEEEIFIVAEEMPKFQGGDIGTFRNWVNKNYKYPTIAADNGIQGNVVVFFVIEKDGKVSNVKVLQSPDPLLSEEAIRLVSSSPSWTPGKNRNMPVRLQYTMTIVLKAM